MICLIAALAQNRCIGRQNGLPWHLSADLKRFRKLTLGHALVMGRKTFESIGRPLPGRRIIVVTRDIDFKAPYGEVVHSVDSLLVKMATGTWFVAGGAEIYSLFLPHADRMYLTHIAASYDGDAFFPPFDETDFTVERSEQHSPDDFFEHAYSFVDYVRRPR